MKKSEKMLDGMQTDWETDGIEYTPMLICIATSIQTLYTSSLSFYVNKANVQCYIHWNNVRCVHESSQGKELLSVSDASDPYFYECDNVG